jgi:hypothetical protein
MTLTLDSLPSELQCAIFRLLDPSALINASQTCTKFRATINPRRQHFVERLLVLECLEEFGGQHVKFQARNNDQEPAWDDTKVKDMRWTCVHCMRLLPHQHFDNHSLLRLKFRKPEPGSPAALPITTWEPMGHASTKAASKRRRETRQQEMKSLLHKYTRAVTLPPRETRTTQPLEERLISLREARMEDFEEMTFSEFENLTSDQEIDLLESVARSIELQICGYRRAQRGCNECRYQLGDLRSHIAVNAQPNPPAEYQTGANSGTPNVPIVKSRRIAYGNRVSRYFPGYMNDSPAHKPGCSRAPVFTIYRDNACEAWYTNYMIRCPGCSSWKEMAEYRCGNVWPKWRIAHQHIWGPGIMENWDERHVNSEFIEALRCHSCYAGEHGRDELANDLLRWYNGLLIPDLLLLERHLQLGWMRIWRSVVNEPRSYVGPGDWRPRTKHIFDIRTEVLSGLPWMNPDKKGGGIRNYRELDQKTIAVLHMAHGRLKEAFHTWFEQVPPMPMGMRARRYRQPNEWNDWVLSWIKGYNALEEQFMWLRECRDEVINRPQSLVNWALGDGAGTGVSGAEMWEERSEFYREKWTSEDLASI